ncbi:5'-hydroxyaverantin dehydrogenase [Grifola frondosa]|uniref:5'-hydroxyaverantin dehydrogenase n=1 Tax=Grifola frondosa TaxID=5627 RepID=A0A1C7M5H8_GRIFR|nr:5'-hydroxyaverantin dehydrogenase [Grifola frondosa]
MAILLESLVHAIGFDHLVFSAKVVIGDIDVAGAEKVVHEIVAAGGAAVSQRCDVTSWDDQVDLFEFARKVYGTVDVVVVDDRPVPPNLKTLQIDLIGISLKQYCATNVVHAILATHLALHHLKSTQAENEPGRVKAIVLMGSVASWHPPAMNVMYGSSKHGVLGLMRTIEPTCDSAGIRVGIVHPWYADTHLLTTPMRLFLAGLPLTPVSRIAAAVLYAAADSDPRTSGCPLLLPDGGEALRLDKELLREGLYEVANARLRRTRDAVHGVRYAVRLAKDLLVLFSPAAALVAGIGVVGFIATRFLH